jgi:hypothetical protein
MIGGKGPTEQEARVRHEYHWWVYICSVLLWCAYALPFASWTVSNSTRPQSFRRKLQQEFKDAKAQYNEICGYPEGLLEQVKLFRLNVVREDINVTEYVHSDSKFKIPKLTKNLPLMGKS